MSICLCFVYSSRLRRKWILWATHHFISNQVIGFSPQESICATWTFLAFLLSLCTSEWLFCPWLCSTSSHLLFPVSMNRFVLVWLRCRRPGLYLPCWLEESQGKELLVVRSQRVLMPKRCKVAPPKRLTCLQWTAQKAEGTHCTLLNTFEFPGSNQK